MLGHHRPASETPFKWCFAGGPMMAHFWRYLVISHYLKTKSFQSWTPSGKTFLIGACKHSLINFPTRKISHSHAGVDSYMGESFLDYSWIQDFEDDFPQKVILKILYSGDNISFFDLFSVCQKTIGHLILKLRIFSGILQVHCGHTTMTIWVSSPTPVL